MDKFSLKWNDFQANVTRSFGVLRQESNLFDVTLVSDDEEHIPAHRLVLSACSGFFKNLFQKIKNQNPVIYLAGVSSGDLKLILDYMYHGEVSVYQEEIDKFLVVANKLQIDGLIGTEEDKDVVRGDFQYKDTYEAFENTINVHKPKTKEVWRKGEPSTRAEVAITVNNTTDTEAKMAVEDLVYKKGDLWFCKACNKSSKHSGQIRWHVETHIEGLSYPCPVCGDSFRSRQSLSNHNRRCIKTNH